MSLLAIRNLNAIARRAVSYSQVLCSKGDGGSGVGKGGGSGGSVREAGGRFGEMEAAQEAAYFKQQERKQLEHLKKHHDDEIKHHEEEIQRHLDGIKRHREKMAALSNEKKDKKGDDSD